MPQFYEPYLASVLAMLGYTIFTNFEIDFEGDSVCEIDVFASMQTPFNESRMKIIGAAVSEMPAGGVWVCVRAEEVPFWPSESSVHLEIQPIAALVGL